jgi:hypothetical protein
LAEKGVKEMSKSQASFHSICSVLLVVVYITGCKSDAGPDRTGLDVKQQPISVTQMSDRRVVLEILTDDMKMLSLYVGEKKWGSSPVGNGKKAIATLEASNQIKMDDGSMGYGIIYTNSVGGVSVTQYLAVTRNEGDLPYGEVTFRHAEAIVKTLDSVICGDIVRPEGKNVPISLKLE